MVVQQRAGYGGTCVLGDSMGLDMGAELT
jgi:hypothetical protein